jgi:hypothetical protein
MAAGLVGSALSPLNPQLWSVLGVPFLWSFRWRQGLPARWLIVATLSAFVSMFLSVLTIGRNPGEWIELYPGPSSLVMPASVLLFLYSVAAMPVAASRIHLSIRRIGQRLIGSHLLAGLIPFTLAALFLLVSGPSTNHLPRNGRAAAMLDNPGGAAGHRAGAGRDRARALGVRPGERGRVVWCRENRRCR